MTNREEGIRRQKAKSLRIWRAALAGRCRPPSLYSTGVDMLVTAGINIVLCCFVARPVQGVGILVPAAVAALLALLFAPSDAAPPVAYIAERGRMASIGGAGTFDGIVLSGIVATYLA